MATRFLAFVVLVTLLGATPAYAERGQTTDHVDDVWRLEEDASYTYDATAPLNSDLVAVAVDHRAADLTIRATYAELSPSARTGTQLLVRVRTDSGHVYAIRGYFSAEGGWVSTSDLEVGGTGFPCDACSVKVNDARNTVKIRVPRAEIGDPTWITFQASALAILRHQQWVDDAFSTYAGSERHSHKLHVG